MQRRVRAGLADRLGHRVVHDDAAVERPLAALAGGHAGHDRGAIRLHRAAVELALAPGDALDHETRVGPDEDAHAERAPRCRDRLGGGVVERCGRREVCLLEQLGRLGRVRPHDPHDHRDVARLLGARLDEPARHLVAAGDAAEDVDQDGVDLRVAEDDPHRRRDPVRPGAAADVEEVGRLAAGALDEIHRGHRQAGPVDHAADRAIELDEGEPGLARLAVGRILLVGIAQRLELGVPGEGGVVERHLGIQADQALDGRARRVGLANDRQRIDLDEVRVVGEHRPDEALGDRDGGLELPAQTHRERELARLVVEQAQHRVGVVTNDRLGLVDGHLLDLDAALGRAHQQDPPRGPVEHGRHVVLADDVGGRRDEHLADRDALDLHAEDLAGNALGRLLVVGQLHPAGLAAPADQHLRLDHHGGRAVAEEASGRRACLGHRAGDRPRGYGQALREEQRLGVGFLDLHVTNGLRWHG